MRTSDSDEDITLPRPLCQIEDPDLGSPRRSARTRLRKVAGVGLGFSVLSMAAWTLAAAGAPRAEPCENAEPKIEAVWNGARKSAVHEGLLHTDASYAESTWARLEARLDTYADAWVSNRREACEATHLRNEQSLELLGRRMACLDGQLADLDALLELWERPDLEVVQHALTAVGTLPSADACSDTIALLQAPPAPRDPAAARELERGYKALARARALSRSGKHQEAQRMLSSLRMRAKDLGYRPFEAEVLIELGNASSGSGDFHEARAWAVEGLHAALAARADRLAVELAATLVFLDGYELGRPEEAHRWARMAEALMESSGEDPALQARLLNAEALTYAREGELERAKVMFDRSLGLQQRINPDAIELGVMAANAGALLAEQGDYAGARTYMAQAVEHEREHLGPGHPAFEQRLANLGAVDLMTRPASRPTQR